MVEPSSQWFGSGFGQNGSTSNRGACAPDLLCAATFFSRTPCVAHNVVSAATSVAPIHRFRLCIIAPSSQSPIPTASSASSAFVGGEHISLAIVRLVESGGSTGPALLLSRPLRDVREKPSRVVDH